MIEAKIDTSRLLAAMRKRLEFPGRTEAKILNHAAYSIALRALRLTPGVPVARITSELNVEIAPRMSLGRPAKYSRKSRFLVSRPGTATKHTNVPLAALIINSSVIRPSVGPSPSTKKYNILKNFRYARHSSPFRGVGRETGRAMMRQAVDTMIKARRKSVKFLASGWIGAIRYFAGAIGMSPPTDEAPSAELRGGGQAARTEGMTISATLFNATGMEGLNKASFNQALHKHGAGPLQSAIDAETKDLLQYLEREQQKQAAEFNVS